MTKRDCCTAPFFVFIYLYNILDTYNMLYITYLILYLNNNFIDFVKKIV